MVYKQDGKVALITGGTKGIGKAIALSLADYGAKVIVNYISDAETAEQTRKEIEKINGFALAFRADVSNYEEVQEMIDSIINKTGKLDILINNAGITRDSLLFSMKDDDWKKVIDINLTGVYNCCKAALRPMIAGHWGRIVNIISPSALLGRKGQTNYSASKGGILSFTRSLAREVARLGITVNAISPGVIETDLTKNLDAKVRDDLLNMIPLRRFGTPEEIAQAVSYLVSEKAGYITGTYISIDGGLT
ncbi:MAG: 3-oxoacyl-[acyl-carrier-protein] reductase [Nitrospirae bacterium]|nr:3-oxoacyl-[acyl-carrier-protein] reductase [Nitrospirota bacterium]